MKFHLLDVFRIITIVIELYVSINGKYTDD